MKRCPKCGEVKPLCEFHKDKYKKDGHKSRCADCCRKDRVEWRKKNASIMPTFSRCGQLTI